MKLCFEQKGTVMKKTRTERTAQPNPFTPGLSKVEVREHAYKLFRDRLPNHPLTLDDWVTAEKDLVNSMEAEESS